MGFPGQIVIYLALAAALCLPPFLALRLFYISYRRAGRRRLPTGRFRFAALITLSGLLYNIGTASGTLRALATGGATNFSRWHAAAVIIAWLCFWIWLFMAIALGRDLGRSRGLR